MALSKDCKQSNSIQTLKRRLFNNTRILFLAKLVLMAFTEIVFIAVVTVYILFAIKPMDFVPWVVKLAIWENYVAQVM